LKEKTRPKKKPKLRVIQGGRREILLGSVQIVASPEHRPPFAVDAVAAEEDTYLVLSADPEVRDPKIYPIRLMTRVIEARPETPGSVLVQGRHPIRFLAIVHDLNQEPTWKEEWIESALLEIIREAEGRRLGSIALPLLGTLHGSLKKERFIVLLRRALEQVTPRYLQRIWLVMPAKTSYKILKKLEKK